MPCWVKSGGTARFTTIQFVDIDPQDKYEDVVERVRTNLGKLSEMAKIYISDPASRQVYLKKVEIIGILGPIMVKWINHSWQSFILSFCKTSMPIYETSSWECLNFWNTIGLVWSNWYPRHQVSWLNLVSLLKRWQAKLRADSMKQFESTEHFIEKKRKEIDFYEISMKLFHNKLESTMI